MQNDQESVESAPQWLRQAWEGAKHRGLDKLTMDEIDAEIAAYRGEKALQWDDGRDE
ncbi:MAG: hypothetical protein ACRD3N_12635 [Terracidiphilus sp.]